MCKLTKGDLMRYHKRHHSIEELARAEEYDNVVALDNNFFMAHDRITGEYHIVHLKYKNGDITIDIDSEPEIFPNSREAMSRVIEIITKDK